MCETHCFNFISFCHFLCQVPEFIAKLVRPSADTKYCFCFYVNNKHYKRVREVKEESIKKGGKMFCVVFLL